MIQALLENVKKEIVQKKSRDSSLNCGRRNYFSDYGFVFSFANQLVDMLHVSEALWPHLLITFAWVFSLSSSSSGNDFLNTNRKSLDSVYDWCLRIYCRLAACPPSFHHGRFHTRLLWRNQLGQAPLPGLVDGQILPLLRRSLALSVGHIRRQGSV